MNPDPPPEPAEALAETLGHPARLITFSKSGYLARHPDHVAIFNANVYLGGRRVWWGDLDLTDDEPKLAALAARSGQTVDVLYEPDGAHNQDAPRLERAVYSVVPSGHNPYQHRHIERDRDGVLRRRPTPRPPRFDRRLLRHRPRLLRFWQTEHKTSRSRSPRASSHLLYIGARDHGQTPLLVLGESTAVKQGACSWSSPGTPRAWPGHNYTLTLGCRRQPRWP